MFQKYLTPKGRISCRQPQDIKNAWYINKFMLVHGTKYDYSKMQYQTQHQKVWIICPTHGEFEQTPQNHLLGNGCKMCGRTFDTAQFIERAKQLHGNIYDYSKQVYSNSQTELAIICPQHGLFSQTPNTHLQGSGCPDCQQQQNLIYVLKCSNTGLIKIGITGNLKRRLKTIGGSNTVLGYLEISNPRNLEKSLHKEYQAVNTYNNTVASGNTEYFKLTEQETLNLLQKIGCV